MSQNHSSEGAERHSESAVTDGSDTGEIGASKRRQRWVRAGLVVLTLAGATAGAHLYRIYRTTQERAAPPQAMTGAVYYCPMHPQYKSDKPGECPICHMSLVKLEPEGHLPDHTESAGRDFPAELPPGVVRISPDKQQLIGVQYGEVSLQPLASTIRTVGQLTYDETKIARVHSKIGGWIEKVHVGFTGQLVRKNQPLITVYSPELLSTQQELFIAKRAVEYLGGSPFQEISSNALSLHEATRERLRLWDIPDEEIERIESTGAPLKTLALYSPVAGFVLSRNAYERQRITPETELYAIADLSTIWVLADLYEYEAGLIRPGQPATMTLAYAPEKTYRGRLTYVYPDVDRMTRTLKVRLELPNPRVELKPGMFANVELRVDYGNQLVIPEQALLDSGQEQIVFVAREGGVFEPRKIRIGPKVGSLVVVREGVSAGERVITSANFLIDSESQLKAALGTMPGMQHGTQEKAPGATQPPEGHRH